MAGELQADYNITGSTLYVAPLRDGAGDFWNGTAFDPTPTDAEWATYVIVMGEDDTTGAYRGDMPAVGAGRYSFTVRLQAGGSPASTDRVVGQGALDWDGAAEVGLMALATAASVDDLPTNAELAAALAAADDAILAAIAALDDLSAAQAQAAAAAALAAYDGPTKAEMDAGLAPLATSAEVDGNLIADHVLRRGFAAAALSDDGDAAGGRNLLRGLRKLVNRISMLTNPGSLTVYEEDDATEAYQQVADTDAGADPVTEIG